MEGDDMRVPARWSTPSRALAIVLLLDGLISIGFGLASALYPRAIFGTIVDLGSADAGSLIFAALLSLSILYVVLGAVCLLAVPMPSPHRDRLAMLMAASHAWIGLKGYRETGREWLSGNPWPDIAIHSFFICAYALLLFAAHRRRKTVLLGQG